MTSQDRNRFYLVSLADLGSSLVCWDPQTPLTIPREELSLMLAEYGLLSAAPDVRLLHVYTTTGSLRCQEVVLYCTQKRHLIS